MNIYLDHRNVRIGKNGWRDVNDILRPFSLLAKLSDSELTEIGVTKQIVEDVQPPQETLFALKERKNQEINASRLSANQSTFTYNGKVFACDQLSRGDIDAVNGIVSLINALPPNWVGGWKASDNSIQVIATVNDWIAFYGAMVAQGTANFVKSQTLKAQLEAAFLAENRAAMESISWQSI